MKDLGTPLLINQPSYFMLNRWVEGGLLNVAEEEGIGTIAYMPLQQGILTGKYLKDIPEDSRANGHSIYFSKNDITAKTLAKVAKLNQIAQERNQSLAQMSLAWVLRHKNVASALIGASRPEQIVENVKAISNLKFSEEELAQINNILN